MDGEPREVDKILHKTAVLYYQCFTEGAGAGVLEDLHTSYMERSSIDEDNPDPYMTAMREGERAVVLKIMAMMKLGSVTPQQEEKV